MSVVMRLVGLVNGQPTVHDGCYLAYYNPNVNGYRGRIETTDDIAKARRFDDNAAVLECWRQVSATKPTRPDGQPNRPLTAFTVEGLPVDE